jgi:chromosome segregation ATPase
MKESRDDHLAFSLVMANILGVFVAICAAPSPLQRCTFSGAAKGRTREMPERISTTPAWAWIVGVLLVIVSIFIGYRVVQTQQHLAAAQSELEGAKQAAEKANAEYKELQTKFDNTTSELKSAESQLAEMRSRLEATQSQLESAKQVTETANAGRKELQTKLDEAASETKSAQSQLAETQSRLEATQSALGSAKQTADQAKAQVAELEKRAASLNSELSKADGQRIELQAKLDEASSEIERLKSELEQAPRAENP